MAVESINLANGEWPPYHSKKLKYYGFVSRIITEAFALKSIKVNYKFLPWKRGMILAQRGDLDGTAVWRYKDKFAKDFYYSDSVLGTNTVFFHLKNFPFKWNSFDDLKGMRIGGTIGYGYNEEYDKAEQSQEFIIHRVPRDEQNFAKLLAGRIDIFPITTEVGYYILQTKFRLKDQQLITHHTQSLTPSKERNLHLLLSKKIEKNKQVLILFNLGLEQLKQSGKLRQYHEELYQGKYQNN